MTVHEIIAAIIAILFSLIALLTSSVGTSGTDVSHEVINKLKEAVNQLQPYSQTGSEVPQPGGTSGQPTQNGNGNNTGNTNGSYGGNTHTVPEINAAAAPTALALLGGGLLLFGERSRRARQSNGRNTPKLAS